MSALTYTDYLLSLGFFYNLVNAIDELDEENWSSVISTILVPLVLLAPKWEGC